MMDRVSGVSGDDEEEKEKDEEKKEKEEEKDKEEMEKDEEAVRLLADNVGCCTRAVCPS